MQTIANTKPTGSFSQDDSNTTTYLQHYLYNYNNIIINKNIRKSAWSRQLLTTNDLSSLHIPIRSKT